ncbi:hypothetical protein VHUM_00480 [Vanrija humicola]|uniref:Cation/H+ exchanger transmembrane domain-containing protein n=1 Tax=Vanrija humicola TaxID=5417 RepID=A0A7D8V528_VANHU|nr:hypothetical protein VHUM_00480 [Vanrija humicola]
MGFHPFEVNAVHLAYTILGAFTVIFSLVSLLVREKLYLGEAPIATVVGIILGPYVLNLFDPYGWGGNKQHVTDEITLEVTRVVIAIGVFAVGVELPKAYMKKHWRSLFFLLGPCMVYGWLVSAGFIMAMIPGLTYLSSLVIAACVTPTDPILAQAVVGGKFADKHVPTHIRHLLSAESGSNDGAAFPFLYIALYLTLDRSAGHAVGEWFYITWLYEVALGIVLGALLGWAARKAMQFGERKKWIDRQSFVAQYVSLAILSIGMCTLLGSDDLLAAFACGTAFAWDGYFNKATEDAVFSNVIDLLFNCAAFIYIGAIIPFKDFGNKDFHLSVWRLIVLAILILLFRRMPVILALYRWIPDIKTFREAVFVGWFGPMGVGAIFISTLARVNIPHPELDGDTSQVDLLQETIGPIVAMLVLASVLTHGLSIPFLLSGRRVRSITYTWSRNPSMDTRGGNEPAWTTHTTRMEPGQQVVINRDDEEGDVGLAHQLRNRRIHVTGDDGINDGKNRSNDDSEEIELERRGTPRTPPLAGYREGDDLVMEHAYDCEGASAEDVKRAALAAARRGSPAPSRHSTTASSPRPASRGSRHSTNEDSGDEHSTNAGSDNDDVGDGYVRRPKPYGGVRAPSPEEEEAEASSKVHSFIPASRLQGKQKQEKEGGWRRFLRVATTSSQASGASAAEEGRSRTLDRDDGFLSPRERDNGRSITINEPIVEHGDHHHDRDHDRGLRLTRTVSRAISFAPEAADSSETAPGVNYGASNPRFKRTPGLGMYRTTSVQDTEETGFKEPTRR